MADPQIPGRAQEPERRSTFPMDQAVARRTLRVLGPPLVLALAFVAYTIAAPDQLSLVPYLLIFLAVVAVTAAALAYVVITEIRRHRRHQPGDHRST